MFGFHSAVRVGRILGLITIGSWSTKVILKESCDHEQV
jgi:hypothetical protein